MVRVYCRTTGVWSEIWNGASTTQHRSQQGICSPSMATDSWWCAPHASRSLIDAGEVRVYLRGEDNTYEVENVRRAFDPAANRMLGHAVQFQAIACSPRPPPQRAACTVPALSRARARTCGRALITSTHLSMTKQRLECRLANLGGAKCVHLPRQATIKNEVLTRRDMTDEELHSFDGALPPSSDAVHPGRDFST
jgi:hypothetical protein